MSATLDSVAAIMERIAVTELTKETPPTTAGTTSKAKGGSGNQQREKIKDGAGVGADAILKFVP